MHIKLKSYENQWHWQGLEFPLAMQKLRTLEKNSPDLVVNVLFNSKKGICTDLRSKQKGKTPNLEQINTHVQSGWCVHSTFDYEHVIDPLKILHGKDFKEKFAEKLEKFYKKVSTLEFW